MKNWIIESTWNIGGILQIYFTNDGTEYSIIDDRILQRVFRFLLKLQGEWDND